MIFLILLFLSAFLISSVSAYFSISGLTAIFPNTMIPIISMGIVLELGKLVMASFVYQYWNKYKVLTRSVLLILTITFSILSSVGVYGYLTRKHIEGTTGISTSVEQVSFVQKQIDMEQSNVVFLQQSLSQGDKVVNNYLTDTSKTVRAEAARTKLLRERQKTQGEITIANKHLLELQQQKDSLSQIQRMKEVDVGPLKYLAALGGWNTEGVVRWFILVLTFVLDPSAILLVVAGNIHRKESKRTVTNDPMLPLADIPSLKERKEEFEKIEKLVDVVLDQKVIKFKEKPEVTPEVTPQVTLDFRSPEKWG